MAAAPSTASPTSWNPAVPPPPVTGAAVGIGLNDGVGGGDVVGLGVGLSLGVGLPVGELLLLAVLVAVEVGVGVALAVGRYPVREEEGVGSPPVPPEVQAASATQASTVMRPQPTAVSLSRCAVHAMAVRPLIEPPRVLGNDHFPVASRRNRRRKETARPTFAADRDRAKNSSGGKTRTTITVSPGCGANLQWRAQHRNITLVR
jgi:hypothetical protein